MSGSHARRKRQKKTKEKRRAGSLNLTMNSQPAGSNPQHRLARRTRGGARLRHLMWCSICWVPRTHTTSEPVPPQHPDGRLSPRQHILTWLRTKTRAHARARRHWHTPVCSQLDHAAHSHTNTQARARYNPYIIRKHADVSPSSSRRSLLARSADALGEACVCVCGGGLGGLLLFCG